MTVRELSDRFRISPELLASVGVRNASDNEVRELLGIHARLGQDLSGIVFPYRDPRDGSLKGHRVRLGKPLSDGQKYLSEKGCRVVFFAANSGIVLTDTTVPIVIVEAEKSALALTSLGERHARKLLAIATGGVWGWKRKVGIAQTPSGDRKSRTGPSPSLDWIAWRDRNAIIAYDSNVAGRPDLEKARLALAVELMTRGAKVFIASTPKRREVNGPDDVIALLGDEEALQMLDRAAQFAAARPVPAPGILASDVKPEKVRWLWPNRIPLGKVTIFDGDPDEGKSTVSLDLAARLTRGWPMPDESEAEYPASGAVVVSLEDGVADTIRPRLEAAGTRSIRSESCPRSRLPMVWNTLLQSPVICHQSRLRSRM